MGICIINRSGTIGGGSISIDDTLSNISENPVQNKVITNKLDEISSTLNSKADMSALATVATTGSYNDLLNKPTIPQGTITGITMNGASKGTSGVVNLGAVVIGQSNNLKIYPLTQSQYNALSTKDSNTLYFIK